MFMKGRAKMPAGVWWGNPKERDQLKDLGVDGRLLLKWIFTKQKTRQEGVNWISVI
jgi:hypothetical protein